MNYDIIGDIHGHADALSALLAKLGYEKHTGAFRHPERQAIFVGDFIDRGPQQLETVEMVRRMVDAGHAQAVMGNHELNAIAWFTPDPKVPGEFLRPHASAKWGDSNFRQHKRFLAEIDGKPELHREIVDWFLSLPLWLDLPELRVVHACWHPKFMAFLEERLANRRWLTEELIPEAVREPESDIEKDTPEPTVFKAVEALVKGIEVGLPAPHSFKDADGHIKSRVRVRWWDGDANTYRKAAMLESDLLSQIPDERIPEHKCIGYRDNRPLFVGHYWLTGEPLPFATKVACVDYSVAKQGKLVAYRWNGEQSLVKTGFVWV